jgi:hypothetical protein
MRSRSALFLFVSSLGFRSSDGRSATNQALIDGSLKYCAGIPEDFGDSRVQGSIIPQVVGSRNYLEEALFDSECTSISACVDKYKSDWILQGIRLAVSFVFFVISLILWLFLGCCACCRCCRQCKLWCCCKEKDFPSYFSRGALIFIWSSFAFFMIVVVVDSVFAGLSANDFKQGTNALLCRTLTLASDVLNGGNSTGTAGNTLSQNYSFIGTDPLYTQLVTLEGTLQASSPAIQAIGTTVNNTVDLENAMNRFSAYLSLTQDMLGRSDTLQPGGGEYQCVVCQACCGSGSSSYVAQMRSAIESSFAESLKKVRSQVMETLTGNGLSDSREAVEKASDIVGNVTQNIETNLGKPVLDSSKTIDLSLLILWIVALVFAISGLVPVFWFILSLVYGVVKSYKASYTNPDDKPMNPCVVSCGWCLSLAYATFMFLIGGLLIVAGYAQASFCDASYDLDSTIDRGFTRFAADFLPNSTIRIVVNSCLRTNGSGDFLGAINVGNGQGPQSMSARTVFENVTQIGGLIYDAFNKTPSFPSIASAEPLLLLTDTMDEYKGMFMIPAEQIAALQQDVNFNVNGPMTTDQIRSGYGSSANCNSRNYNLGRTPAGEIIGASLVAAGFTLPDDRSSVSVPGVADYRTDTALVTQLLYTGTCADLSVDKDSFNPFSSLLYWKSLVSTKTDFRCDTITEVVDPDTNLIGFTRAAGTCATPTAFDNYIDSLKTALLSAANDIDTAAATTKTRIENDILSAINNLVIPPVQTVLDNSDCRVLRNGWNALYNVICSQLAVGVNGLGYTFAVFAGMSLLAVIVMFSIWRNLKDNISLWRDLIKERTERRSAIRNVVTASPSPAAVQIVPDAGPRKGRARE